MVYTATACLSCTIKIIQMASQDCAVEQKPADLLDGLDEVVDEKDLQVRK